MATVLKDAVVSINGGTISQHCSEVTIEDSAEEVDVTGFTTSGYRDFLPGLKTATITLQVYAGTAIDNIVQPLYTNMTDGTVKVRESTASTKIYTMVGKVYTYSPIAGAVGDANTTAVTFNNSSTAGLTVGTT